MNFKIIDNFFFGNIWPSVLKESGMSCGNKSRPSLGLDLCIWRSDGKGSKVDWKWRIKFWPFFWRPYQKCSFVGLCLIQSKILYGKTLKKKPPFRNKMFLLDEMTWQNTSKFAIFYIGIQKPKVAFSIFNFMQLYFFPLWMSWSMST